MKEGVADDESSMAATVKQEVFEKKSQTTLSLGNIVIKEELTEGQSEPSTADICTLTGADRRNRFIQQTEEIMLQEPDSEQFLDEVCEQ